MIKIPKKQNAVINTMDISLLAKGFIRITEDVFFNLNTCHFEKLKIEEKSKYYYVYPEIIEYDKLSNYQLLRNFEILILKLLELKIIDTSKIILQAIANIIQYLIAEHAISDIKKEDEL